MWKEEKASPFLETAELTMWEAGGVTMYEVVPLTLGTCSCRQKTGLLQLWRGGEGGCWQVQIVPNRASQVGTCTVTQRGRWRKYQLGIWRWYSMGGTQDER